MKYAVTTLLLPSLLASLAMAAPVPAAKLTLRPSYGGAVIDGRVYVPTPDTLVGAWSAVGAARLMRCSPICEVVSSLPMKNTTVLGSESTYRIALGGQFIRGQRIAVSLRFRSGRVLVTTAVVNR
ncbi:hypothetical protein [Deinococcus fonticola]|uniref:hypothetical protein n=1 Tax=Deinococcus fonticola TaxID=2528713 RepID=UPI001074E70F|nr:hypothetical protein [Deinococcus fonticola]